MPIAELKRIEETPEGTIGVLLLDKQIQCFVLENRKWVNAPNVSCIPAGNYVCRRVQSPKFNETFEVMDVPGRFHILFHSGNTTRDTSGCLLPGRRVGYLQGPRAVLDSSKAFYDLMTALDGHDEFKLTITESF